METEFGQAVGKSIGEVLRDIDEFLSLSCVVHPVRGMDLRSILPTLTMGEQFAFALFSEGYLEGMDTEEVETFVLRACASVGAPLLDRMKEAFRHPDSQEYRSLVKRFGSRFSIGDDSYWGTAIALAIDAENLPALLSYLRTFTVTLMEFAYMGGKNPKQTYAWQYYESFRRLIDDLQKEPEKESPELPLSIAALGGTSGKKEEDGYFLSLGLDLKNPNKNRMACEISLDVTLKDQAGKVITVIRDKICGVDPDTVFHYGITRKIHGAPVAGISASAKAAYFLRLSTPIRNHIAAEGLTAEKQPSATRLKGTLQSRYDKPLHTLSLHYQYRNAKGKILGGGNEWLLDGIRANECKAFSSVIPVAIPALDTVVCSADFQTRDLLED